MATDWKITVEEDDHADFAAGQHLVWKWRAPKFQYVVDQIPHGLYLWIENWKAAEPEAWVNPSRISARRVAEINVADALSIPPAEVHGAKILAAEVFAAFAESLSVALGRVKPQQLVTPEQAWRHYTEKVKLIPEVQEVRLSSDDEGPSVWTIISATPFDDEPRERIIDVQIDVMQAMEKPMLGFQLVNLRELGSDVVGDDVVPGDSIVLWNR